MKFEQVWEKMKDHPGYFFPKESEALFNACMEVPEGGVVVELGSLFGRSSIIIGEVSKIKKYDFYCVDAFVTDGEPAKETFIKSVKDVYSRCNLIEGFTDEVVKSWKKPIDLLFIDANHQDEGINADCENWLPFVKPRGLAAFHDYKNLSFPAVRKRVDQHTGGWDLVAIDVDSLIVKRKP